MQATHLLRDILEQFQALKDKSDRAVAQVSDDQFFAILDAESNSIALIYKHLGGNLLSRWTDFLEADGEKPARNRDLEFVIEDGDSREKLASDWEAGWNALFEALETLTPADLDKMVLIRKQPHSVVQAINRSMTHTAYHIGQIVFLAKHFAGTEWKTLSVPRGKSQEHAAELHKKYGASS